MMTMSDDGQNAGPDPENPTQPIELTPAPTAPNSPNIKKWKILLCSTLLVAVIAILVSFLPRNDNDVTVSSSSAASEGFVNGNDVNSKDPAESEGMTTDLTNTVTNTTTSSSNDYKVSSSATSSSTSAILSTTDTLSSTSTTSSTTPNTLPSTPATSTSTPVTSTSSSAAFGDFMQFVESNGPLEAKVRMIDRTAVDSYNSCAALKDDIANALKHFANSIIVVEETNDWWAKCDPEDPNWNPWGENYYPPIAMAASADSQGTASIQEDSYGTNNQVEGVDEADIVKSDGTYVYAAYGDLLYVWNATDGTTGTSVTRMPYNETNCTDAGGPMPIEYAPLNYYDYEDGDGGDTVTTSTIASTSTSTKSSGKKTRHRQQRKRRSMSMPYYPDPCYQPKPQILSLLLHRTRLTAIVSENNFIYQPYSADSTPSLIDDYSSLTVRVYDVSTVPTDGSPLTLLGEKKIKGNYNSARSIDSTGVVITTSYVNTQVMANSLYRSQPLYCGLNNTEYVEKAKRIALSRSDVFAEQLINELDLNYGCNHIFQISAMQSGNTSDATDGNLLSQFVSVMSFNSAAKYDKGEIPVEVSGSFASGYLSSVYVSQDFVAALVVGSNYNPNTTSWDQSTFILGFDISDPTPVPFSFGTVSGSPINQYAADLYDGYFRIATTEWHWSEVNMNSTTTNKISVLQLPDTESDDATMEVVGETEHFGKPNESIYSVRFIGDKGYVVTFEQVDPFIIVELSDPEDPRVVGELELPGYSSYLHPIKIDGLNLMLGIGQEVDETTGWTTGVKISLFDISDPENPVETTSLVDKNAYSNAQNDFKAFRYLPLSQKLIIPLSEYTWGSDGNFDGFIVYDVAINKIKARYNISHASSEDIYSGCWYNAYMPPRSLVFKSKVTTILSHTVISTDLEDGTEEWQLNLDEDLNKTRTNCWSYFGYY